MDQTIINNIRQGLEQALSAQFGMPAEKVQSLGTSAVHSLTGVIKTYVLKNGTGELEQILTGQTGFDKSGIRQEIVGAIGVTLQSSGTEGEQSKAIASFASDHLVGALVKAFSDSGKSRNLDGIAEFFGIDKNILKMANSPAAKIFGKFF